MAISEWLGTCMMRATRLRELDLFMTERVRQYHKCYRPVWKWLADHGLIAECQVKQYVNMGYGITRKGQESYVRALAEHWRHDTVKYVLPRLDQIGAEALVR